MLTIGGGSTNGQPKNTISEETHLQMARRLAAIVNMHGTPGSKPKKG